MNPPAIFRNLHLAALAIILGSSLNSIPASAQQQTRPAASRSPIVCLFFEPGTVGYASEKDSPAEERIYGESVRQVYRLWCTTAASTSEQRSAAADAMVAAWKRLSDRDMPYNAAFHESGYLDLLALLGLTHELPALMQTDEKFTSDWVKGCIGTCFDFYLDPEKPSGHRFIVVIFRMVDDLRHNLKKEPASEPVLDMLYSAKFRLGD
jgi:hypothetical protein